MPAAAAITVSICAKTRPVRLAGQQRQSQYGSAVQRDGALWSASATWTRAQVVDASISTTTRSGSRRHRGTPFAAYTPDGLPLRHGQSACTTRGRIQAGGARLSDGFAL